MTDEEKAKELKNKIDNLLIEVIEEGLRFKKTVSIMSAILGISLGINTVLFLHWMLIK